MTEDIKNFYQKDYSVTGTRHGSIICCDTEGQARRIFHNHYNGESILYIWHRGKELNNGRGKINAISDDAIDSFVQFNR
jgi:hypothetical protein